MKEEQISQRQLLVLLFTGLLSPAARMLPARVAQEAGKAGWLAPLAALPAVLALCWAVKRLFRTAPQGAGIGEVIQQTLGRPLGKGVLLLYLGWGVFLLCANIRLFGLRFLSTGYRNAPLGFFLVVGALLVVWLARKPLPVFARTAELFYLALALCLGICLAFGSFQIRAVHLLPLWTQDLPPVLRAVRPVLAVFGYGIFGACLLGDVAREEGGRVYRRAVVFCLVLTGLQVVCLGTFGPGLTGRMHAPFFQMVKGIGMPGAFERGESVVTALWALADLVLLTLLLHACCALAKSVFGFAHRRSAAVPLILIALVGGWLLFPDTFRLKKWLTTGGEWGNLLFGFLLPALLLAVGLLRGRERGGTSCGPREEKRAYIEEKPSERKK